MPGISMPRVHRRSRRANWKGCGGGEKRSWSGKRVSSSSSPGHSRMSILRERSAGRPQEALPRAFEVGLVRGTPPQVSHREAVGQRVIGVDDVLSKTGDPRGAGKQGNHRPVGTDGGLFYQPAGKRGAQNPFVHEVLV